MFSIEENYPNQIDMNQPVIAITQQPNDQKFYYGDNFILSFSISSFQHYSSCWYFNNKPIPPGQFEVVQENFQCILKGGMVVPRHQGFYYCKLVTVNGSVVATRKVFVSIAFRPRSPEMRQFQASDKVALLIGNDNYEHFNNLECASLDAYMLSKVLREQLHFKTLSFSNLSRGDMMVALDWFCQLCRSGCYCVVYFSGHGYSVNTELYLVPTDATAMTTERCISVQWIARKINVECDPELTLVLPDTCRINAEVTNNNVSVQPTTGNVVFAYATIHSQRAVEVVEWRQSIFNRALLEEIDEPIRVDQMISTVMGRVRDLSQGTQVVELCHTLAENRCLTDTIVPDINYERLFYKWTHYHDVQSPILFRFLKGGHIKLTVSSILTNCIGLKLDVVAHGRETIRHKTQALFDHNYITQSNTNVTVLQDTGGRIFHDDDKLSSIWVSGLQNLVHQDECALQLRIEMRYILMNDIEHIRVKRCQYKLHVNFARLWHDHFTT